MFPIVVEDATAGAGAAVVLAPKGMIVSLRLL